MTQKYLFVNLFSFTNITLLSLSSILFDYISLDDNYLCRKGIIWNWKEKRDN